MRVSAKRKRLLNLVDAVAAGGLVGVARRGIAAARRKLFRDGRTVARGRSSTAGRSRAASRSGLAGAAESVESGTDGRGAEPLDVEATAAGSTRTPSVAWTFPTDGDVVCGRVALRIDVEGVPRAERPTVEYSVDGESWQTAAYDPDTGHYGADWDAAALRDGDHELAARALDATGTVVAAASTTVTVETASDAPTIDGLRVVATGGSDPDRITVDWSVGVGTGDLDGVAVALADAETGRVVDVRVRDATGDRASGTDEFSIGHARAGEFEVTLTATDAAGNAATETRTVAG